MPGMTSGLNINDPIVVAAFRSALLHQGIAALLIFAVLVVAWVAIREWRPPSATDVQAVRDAQAAAVTEPGWRQVLRIGFGLLWLFDGILQAQPAMAVGRRCIGTECTADDEVQRIGRLAHLEQRTAAGDREQLDLGADGIEGCGI